MFRKVLFVAAFAAAALIGCDDYTLGPQIASSARAQQQIEMPDPEYRSLVDNGPLR